MSAAAALPINSESFDFHGYRLSATKDLRCLFCRPRDEVKDAEWPPAISFLSQSRDEALRVHAQLTICAEHLRELANKAEELAPERWTPEADEPRLRQPSNRSANSRSVPTARLLTKAIHSVWEEWAGLGRPFRGERPDMQVAFAEDLGAKLPSTWCVKREAKLGAPRGFSAWRMYDIGVFENQQLVGLVELSYGDTNVPHALHNGELKLLGACEAVGSTSGRTYSTERALDPQSVSSLCTTLENLPVRGLFFVNPGPHAALDVEDRAMWWETKGKGFEGETRFRSVVMAPDTSATLRHVFRRLSDRGVSCWFYSLCGEERIEYLASDAARN